MNQSQQREREWLCDTCRTIYPTTRGGFDLRCKTDGCGGLLRPSTFTERRLEAECANLRQELADEREACARYVEWLTADDLDADDPAIEACDDAFNSVRTAAPMSEKLAKYGKEIANQLRARR